MEDSKVIDLEELKTSILKVFEMLSDEGVREIPIEHESYWNTLSPDKYDLSKDQELGVGSLRDDLEEVQKLSSGEYELCRYDFYWIAYLLLYIAEKPDSKKDS